MNGIKFLNQLLTEEIGRRNIEGTEIPKDLIFNLNPNFPLRPYQIKAFQYFLNYWNKDFSGKQINNHHLLFQMATGSGKTLIMAGLIFYLFKEGYRNFLFFVNSTNIIDKTRDNFLNPASTKYLFAEKVELENKQIHIKEVENFQAANPEDINIVFSTIQGLHTRLNTPKENSLTYDDFEDNKIVLISDEAHHINTETRRGANNLSEEEKDAIKSWEGTVNKILFANLENVLLEFTATAELSHPDILEKYKDKLIFDYSLREFRKDGYSKDVKVIQAGSLPFDRALQGIILSQYRLKVFEKYKKKIKPVILFKSKTINESRAFFDEFKNSIQQLQEKNLERLEVSSSDKAIKNAFHYFKESNITLENLITELKEDFSEEKLISVNSKDESEQKQLAINSLEDENNEYRAVFAVDKLNEGWDVLNLFDIVRLYDTRDAKDGKPGKTTMSEAQLIGRGARYCPFQITTDQPLTQRKYDNDIENELRICEELYYYSANNPKYIQELNTALIEIGIKAKENIERLHKLKHEFTDSQFYKSGSIYLNEKMQYDRMDIVNLHPSIIEKLYKVTLKTGYTKSIIVPYLSGSTSEENKQVTYNIIGFGRNIVQKAINKLEFYKFSNLIKLFPKLNSISEFISSENFLAKIRVEVSGLPDQIKNLSPRNKLNTILIVLNDISKATLGETTYFKGSKMFYPFPLKSKISDKTLTFSFDGSEEREYGQPFYGHTTKKDIKFYACSIKCIDEIEHRLE